MPLFRRSGSNRPTAPEATVVVRIHEEPTETGAAVGSVEWIEGEAEFAALLPGVYFDKILTNVRGSEATELVERVKSFVSYEADNWTGGDEDAYSGMVNLAAPRESELGHVRVELMLAQSAERLGCATHFNPLRAANPTFAEVCLWVLWDWTCWALVESDVPEDRYTLLENCLAQCLLYEETGPPSPLQVGQIPWVAASMMRDVRLREDRAWRSTLCSSSRGAVSV
jgi:hypothetical protein